MPATEVKLILIKESDFVIEETQKDVYITGTKFTMPSFGRETWSNKNLIIQTYELTLTEDIYIPSKRISINTRFLRLFTPRGALLIQNWRSMMANLMFS